MKAEKDKLEILQSLDHFRTWRYWKSLDDQRVCILCAKKFNGHEVQITRSDNGKYELQCPTKDCNSGPHQWVYPNAPQIPTRPSRAGGVIHRKQGRKLGTAFHRLDCQDLPSRTPGIIHRKQRSRPGRMVTIAERGAVDRGSAGANLIPTRRQRHSKHSEQPPRNPCRDALTSHSLGCYFQRGNGPSGSL